MSNMEYTQKRVLPKEKTSIPRCTGCGNPILDRFFYWVSPDTGWHEDCLKCTECKESLAESRTCFVKDGNTFCTEDYNRLYGIRCGKCQKLLRKNDIVMRTCMQIYHIGCFRCEGCGRHLVPGDKFYLRDGQLWCTADVPESLIEEYSKHPSDYSSSPDEDELSKHLDMSSPNHIPTPTFPQRTTRARTVLSKTQLQLLQACYRVNPRPDALLKEQLVEMTGLSSRVIRVWFQNKRCKDKKKSAYLQQTPEQANQKIIADTKWEIPSPDSPIDFLKFQESWRVIKELAIQSDGDNWLGTSSSSESPKGKLMNSQFRETSCNSLVSSPVSTGIQ